MSHCPNHFAALNSSCRAHAALSPWEGQNALDAAVLAYNNIALLRQQVRPTHRVHGVFKGKDLAANSTCSPLDRFIES